MAFMRDRECRRLSKNGVTVERESPLVLDLEVLLPYNDRMAGDVFRAATPV
jgi:hypothetical protein